MYRGWGLYICVNAFKDLKDKHSHFFYRKDIFMFDIAIQFMVQMVELLPGIFGLYVLFDFLGSLIFGKR